MKEKSQISIFTTVFIQIKVNFLGYRGQAVWHVLATLFLLLSCNWCGRLTAKGGIPLGASPSEFFTTLTNADGAETKSGVGRSWDTKM